VRSREVGTAQGALQEEVHATSINGTRRVQPATTTCAPSEVVMAFTFAAPTRLALASLGVSTENVTALEAIEELARKRLRAFRIPSESARLRAQARRLERLERKARRRK
jgi:hypothetical protein